MKKRSLFFGIAGLLMLLVSCNETADIELKKITFADVSWDSVQVHNRIMGYIIEEGLGGYKAEYMVGDTIPLFNGLMQGDIDVTMESWHSSYPEIYEESLESGKFVNLGENMPDAPQGWWIPRYLVEGDDALAPGLKSVDDLQRYAHLFKDPEDPSKGNIFGGVAGWAQMKISEDLFASKGLDEFYNMTTAGSNAALAASMAGTYAKKRPWVGYYWAPTAILGKLDMILLDGARFAPALVHILVNNSLEERAPDLVEILKKYGTSVDMNSEFLAIMEDEGLDSSETAIWFLNNREDVWTTWVSPQVAKKVKKSLEGSVKG